MAENFRALLIEDETTRLTRWPSGGLSSAKTCRTTIRSPDLC